MTKPLTIVTGIHPDAMSSTVLSLLLDLPKAVMVRHRIELERSVLVRVVSDITGVIEQEEIDLEHACVPCAVREDVLPTLERVARDPRWDAVVAQLPVSAHAEQLCDALAQDRATSAVLSVNSVVAAIEGPRIQDDLLGDRLLADDGLGTSQEDRRGVGEVLAGMVEYADVVVVTEHPDPVGVDLVRALARPEARVVTGSELVDASVATRTQHNVARTRLWVDPLSTLELPALDRPGVWRVDLRSDRAFHPRRLMDRLERLGGGRHRSKGCFWLPTRPAAAHVWVGAGGQVSIDNSRPWGRRPPHTRLVITGAGTAPAHLQTEFDSMLLQPGETYAAGAEDGFEPWLGPIRDIA